MRYAVSSVFVLLIVTSIWTSDETTGIAANGVVDGYAAVGFWPEDPKTGRAERPDRDCTVHLVPAEDLSIESTAPCGVYFNPSEKPGAFLWWLEQGFEMSHQRIMYYARRGPGAKKGSSVTATMLPSGLVGLRESVRLENGVSFRLVHGEHFVSRRTEDQDAANRGMLIPSGAAIAALKTGDEDGGEYTGLTRPFRVRPNSTTSVAPNGPDGESTHVIVRLQHSFPLGEHLAVTLHGSSGTAYSPEFISQSPAWTLLTWYGIKEKVVSVSVESSVAWAGGRDVRLRPGKIEHVVIDLQKLPNLNVEYLLPEELDSPAISIEMVEPGNRVIREPILLAQHSGNHVFEDLPVAEVRAVISTGQWVFAETVDLTTGRDAAILIEPIPIRISGSVLKGQQPVSGTVEFYSADEWRRSESEDEGRYKALLFEPPMLVRVQASGNDPDLSDRGDHEWHTQPVDGVITGNTEYDISLPDNRWDVVVQDGRTNTPVQGAEIRYSNRPDNGRRMAASLTTNKFGEGHFPALWPGELVLFVSANGYKNHEQSFEIPVGHSEKTLSIALQAIDEGLNIHVLLRDGRPAAGAKVMLFNAPVFPPLAFETCDANGKALLEENGGSWIGASHPESAFYFGGFRAPDDGEEVVLTLQDPGPPMAIRVVGPGGRPVPNARFIVWVDGVAMDRMMRRLFLPSSSSVADAGGHIALSGLPQKDISVLSWYPNNPELEVGVRGGRLDYRGKLIQYPWSSFIEIEAVE